MDKEILFKSFDLTKDDFYKRDHEMIEDKNLRNYNILDKLIECGKN